MNDATRFHFHNTTITFPEYSEYSQTPQLSKHVAHESTCMRASRRYRAHNCTPSLSSLFILDPITHLQLPAIHPPSLRFAFVRGAHRSMWGATSRAGSNGQWF